MFWLQNMLSIEVPLDSYEQLTSTILRNSQAIAIVITHV